MQVSAKTDYALRAASELALAATEDAGPIKGDWISETQGIPKKFMENILHDLKRSGIVRTRRGASGGYWLALPAEGIVKLLTKSNRAVLVRADGELLGGELLFGTAYLALPQTPIALRIDTPIEVDYYHHGGILPFVLRQLLAGTTGF